MSALAFAPGGEWIASGSTNGLVSILDWQSGTTMQSLSPNRSSVTVLVVTPDGGTLLSGGADGVLRAIDARTGTRLWAVSAHGSKGVSAVACEPGGKWAVSSGQDGWIRAWDLRTGDQIVALPPQEASFVSVSVDPKTGRVLTASLEGVLEIWDPEGWSRQSSHRFHPDPVRAVALSAERIAYVTREGVLRLGGTAQDAGESLLLSEEGGAVLAIGDRPGQSPLVLAGQGQSVRVFDAGSGDELLARFGHSGTVRALARGPDGTWLASGGAEGFVRVWDLATGQERLAMKAHSGSVLTLEITPDGKRIVSAGEDPRILISDAASGEEVHALEGPWKRVVALAVSPDSGRIASASTYGTHRIWDAATGDELATFESTFYNDPKVTSLDWAPDGSWIVSTGIGRVDLLDPRSGTLIRSFVSVTTRWMRDARVSSAGDRIIALEGGGRLWAVHPSEDLQISQPTYDTWAGLSIAPNGQSCATVGRQWLLLWEVQTLEFLDMIYVPGTPVSVTHLDERIAVGCSDGTISVYDFADPPRTPRPRAVPRGHARRGGEPPGRLPGMEPRRRCSRIRARSPRPGDEGSLRDRRGSLPPSRTGRGTVESRRILERLRYLYERVCAIDPDIGRAHAGRAWLKLLWRESEAAAKDLQAAFDLDPEHAGNYSARALHRYQEMDLEGCLEDLEHCVARGHRLEWVSEMKAKIFFAQERFEESARLHQELADAGGPHHGPRAEVARRMAGFLQEELAIRAREKEADDLPRVKLVTEKGPVVLELYEDSAPGAVANFIRLVEDGFYDGTRFHQARAGSGIQGGNPTTDDGPGFRIWVEVEDDYRHPLSGSLMTTEPWPTTHGSRFSISTAPLPNLDGRYAVFGRVLEGLEIVRSIERGTLLEKALVLRKRAHEYEPVRLR